MLSDRIGRRPLLITFARRLDASGTVPIMTALLEARGLLLAGAGCSRCSALVIITGYTSINAVCEGRTVPDRRPGARAWPCRTRIANALFGGTAEYVALWFKNAGIESGFYWYVAGCAAVSLVVYLTMRETRDIDLNRVGRRCAPDPVATCRPHVLNRPAG